jgi:hypothetical protein
MTRHSRAGMTAAKRLAAIRKICVESFENYGHRAPMSHFWLIDVIMCRRIYRLTAPAAPKGRKR